MQAAGLLCSEYETIRRNFTAASGRTHNAARAHENWESAYKYLRASNICNKL